MRVLSVAIALALALTISPTAQAITIIGDTDVSWSFDGENGIQWDASLRITDLDELNRTFRMRIEGRVTQPNCCPTEQGDPYARLIYLQLTVNSLDYPFPGPDGVRVLDQSPALQYQEQNTPEWGTVELTYVPPMTPVFDWFVDLEFRIPTTPASYNADVFGDYTYGEYRVGPQQFAQFSHGANPVEFSAIPEPSTALLVSLGLIGLARRRP